MNRNELHRWLASIGIFYVLNPASILLSQPLYARVLPGLPQLQLSITGRAAFALVGLLGITLAYLSMRDMVRHGRGHPFDLTGRERLSRPTQNMLRTGVYYWTRNPMGLGDLFLYAGLAGVTESWHSLLINIPVWAAIVCWNHCINERPALVRRFGEEFLEYERTTSCLFPGIKTFRKLRRQTVQEPRL